ncbi:MAG TPA: M1 family metallopeptidase [Terriglobales bacterium]|nr:M1 family metallopeptidase [Terriglobales bacterium]
MFAKCSFLLIVIAASSLQVFGQAAPNTAAIPATTSAINSAQPLSQRIVAYDIDAKYDAKSHSLDGAETLTYHNTTGQPLDTFPFHLYLNGFQPKATWVREAKQNGTRDETLDKWETKYYGLDEIKSFEVLGQGDLTSQLQFIQPDDGNKDDHTVVQVHLPKPIPPNGFVQFKIKFRDQFPETLARTGWKRDFLLAGQWFPKVGVWWHGAWNCHQFHGTTEFFADFGVYDVKVTVPQTEVVGATGVEVSNINNPDGTKTLTYHGDDIHDFAWTASPHYKILEDEFQGSMGPVKLNVMMQPAHWSQAERHARVLKETLDHFERWYGPYPYKTLTLVDPEVGSAAGGMEYPTFITGETNWWMPGGLLLPELVVEHEFGHQYWYGMVATNEFEDAWMDEGINSYTEVQVLDSIAGPNTSILNQWGITAGERELQRQGYIGVADLDPIAQDAWKYFSFNSYGGITYGKTASVLLTLEGIIGEDTMQKAMHTYFMRYRFTHPTKEDFLKTVEEVSGKDLRWYFNQAIYGTQVLNYEVLRTDSSPVDWYKKEFKEKKGETEYESNVWIHRKDDFIFPIDIEVKFDNGEKVRERWNGQSRWIRYSYQKKAKLESVEIDPDSKILLDRNNFNNSHTDKANSAPVRKLANYWTFITQFLAQMLAWWMV